MIDQKEKLGNVLENDESLRQVPETGVGQGGEIKSRDEMVDLEVKKEVPLPKNIETWLEKHEKVGGDLSQINDDGSQSGGEEGVIKIPGSRKTLAENLKKPVSEAGRWLSTFIRKLIRIKEGKVEFEEK